ISSSPGSASTRRAISFAIVAVGTKTASSWPSVRAMRSSRRLTVGSSRSCSSPTSAAAIASRIPAVGCVSVSERRLITVLLWLRRRAGETRISLGEQEHVAVRLLLIPKAVGAEVAHPFGHAAHDDRYEPAEERQDLQHLTEDPGQDHRRYSQNDPKKDLPAALPLGLHRHPQIDRVIRRPAVEPRIRVGEQIQVRVEAGCVDLVLRLEAVHTLGKSTQS